MGSSSTEIWIFVMGAALSIIGFMSVLILNMIRGEIRSIKESLKQFETDMRDGIGGLERRITHVEDHLEYNGGYRRRSANGHSNSVAA